MHVGWKADEGILQERDLKVVLDRWRADYRLWMRPETLRRSWDLTAQQWHQKLRTAFRSHLFQLMGSFELTVFFIVAPFNNENLEIFRYFEQQSLRYFADDDDERNGWILKQSKWYVRNPTDVR